MAGLSMRFDAAVLVVCLVASAQVTSLAASNAARAQEAQAPEARQYAARPSCIAVAKRRGGKADPIPETRKATFGRKPCARALKDCERRLEQIKKRGRHLDAGCVVVRTTGL